MKANNNQGRRGWEGKKVHFASQYESKFNSALVEQGTSMFNVFEACMCANQRFIFIFTQV